MPQKIYRFFVESSDSISADFFNVYFWSNDPNDSKLYLTPSITHNKNFTKFWIEFDPPISCGLVVLSIVDDYGDILDSIGYPVYYIADADIEISGHDTVLYTDKSVRYTFEVKGRYASYYNDHLKAIWDEIPQGWRFGDGFTYSYSRSLIPDSIHGGNIKGVPYIVVNDKDIGNVYTEGHTLTKSITRDFGTIKISGPNTVTLGDTNPKAFSVPDVSFYDYTWTVDPDMTITSVNRNSSNVSFHCSGGKLKCTIRHKYVNDQTIASKTVRITKPRPTILGELVVCDDQTFQLSSIPKNLKHTEWITSSNVNINNATNTSATIKVTDPGDSWIKANIRILDCPAYGLDQKYFWAGVPLRPDAQPDYATINQWELLTLRISAPPKGYPDTYYWYATGAIQIINSSIGTQTTVEGQSVGYGYYTVTAHNKCGNSSVTHGTVNVERNVVVYPNPTKKDVFVQIEPAHKLKSTKLEQSDEVEVKIYDINSGSLLQKMTFSTDKFKVSLSSYPSGTYLFKVKKDGHEYSTKIIKQ